MHRKETDHGLQLERNTLRFLCSVLIKSGTRVEICKLLDPRVFEDALQRVVFEEIRELGSIDSRRLRELLPAAGIDGSKFSDFLKRSEEHTSELQSRSDLVCRLLLEKKKKKQNKTTMAKKHRIVLEYSSTA